MIISSIINDSFGLLSKQLRFYCWHFRRSLDQRQRQELIELLYEQHFERLANKIRSLYQNTSLDCKQQVGKLLFEQCLSRNRRHQLIQLIESDLVDINVRLDNYGRTLLHRSAYNLDVDLVKILINHNVNIRLRDYAGNTALHIAIQSYRNGAVIFGNGTDVVKNLTTIIELLLNADRNLQEQRYTHKRIKLQPNQDVKSMTKIVKPVCRGNTYRQDIRQYDRTKIGLNSIVSPLAPKTIGDYDSEQKTDTGTRKNLSHIVGAETPATMVQFDQSDKNANRVSRNDHEDTTPSINPILLEDSSSPLIDTKNAFGRTALHYCVLVVGEQHLGHFVKLLISYGADTDIVDTRMKTPLYCLVKRPGISAFRQKCLAIKFLLESRCDDLGLAIDPDELFSDKYIKEGETNIATLMNERTGTSLEPIFTQFKFKRIPSLKHISRLYLIRNHDDKIKLKRQVRLALPDTSPRTLTHYVNRRILDQTELF